MHEFQAHAAVRAYALAYARPIPRPCMRMRLDLINYAARCN